MKWRMFFLLVLLSVLLVACGTTGKKLTNKLVIEDNEYCVINVNPEVSTKSGDSDNTSANTTKFEDLVKIPDPSDALEKKIIDGVNTKILEAGGKVPGATGEEVVEEIVVGPDQENAEEEPGDSDDQIDENPGEVVADNNGLKDVPFKIYDDMRLVNGRMFRWMEFTGSHYKKITAVFPGINYQFTVEDPAHDQNGASPRDRAAGVWFCGTEIEGGKMPNNAASIFSPAGYTDTKVIIYFHE